MDKFETDMTDIEKSKSDSMFGQAQGVRESYEKNSNMYSQNAEYSEKSRQQSTDTKIAAQGGIDKAVATDVAEAAIKASQQQKGLEGSASAYLQSKEGGGHSKEQADAMTKAMLEGGRGAAETMKNILASAGGLALNKSTIQTSDELGSVNQKMANYNDQEFQNNKVKGMKDNGGTVDSLMDDGQAKTGASMIMAEAASRARKYAMKDSLVDDAGKEMAFSTDMQGNMGRFSLDGSTKLDNSSSEKSGASYENNMDKLQKVEAFNMHQKAHGGEQIRYDEKTGKINVPNKETAQQFAEFVGDTDLVSKTRQNALDETLAEIGNYLGVGSTGVVAGVGGAVVGLGAMALGNKVLPRNKPIPSKVESDSSNKHSNSKANNIDSKHNNSFNNVKNYTEDYQKSQASYNKETANLENLQTQRDHLAKSGKDTTVLDNKIDEASQRADSHRKDMDEANRNIKAEKYNASKDMEREEAKKAKSKSSGAVKGGMVGMLATSLLNNVQDVFGIDSSQNRTLTAIDNVANFSDGAFESVFKAFDGITKGGFQALTGDFSKGVSSVASGFTDAGKHLLDSYNNTIGGADARFATANPAPAHLQNFASAPAGYYTQQAISADMQQQAVQAQLTTANNMQALVGMPSSRAAVGFTVHDANQNPVTFTTDKQSKNMTINGNDTGVGYKQFSSFMQNQESAAQLASAISNSDFNNNKEAYNTTNNLLQEMSNQNLRANMQQKIHNNASDTNRTMQHKESLEANNQKHEDKNEL